MARIQEYGSRQWRNDFGINEREQQYVYIKSQCGSESGINGQRRLPYSKRFLRNGMEI